MAVTTRPPRPAGTLARFDRAERVVHWANALLFGVLLATGAILYLAPMAELIGRRRLVEDIHVYCGLALPAPLAVALAGSWGRALRRDIRRLNRWSHEDRTWMRALLRRGGWSRAVAGELPAGKFNAGQKLNAAFVAGSGLVMLGTGLIMRWYRPWPLNWRTGATFVHDWLALAVGAVIVGHVGMALRDPDAMGAMWGGGISRSWAERHAPAWVDGRDGDDDTGGRPPAGAAGRREAPSDPAP